MRTINSNALHSLRLKYNPTVFETETKSNISSYVQSQRYDFKNRKDDVGKDSDILYRQNLVWIYCLLCLKKCFNFSFRLFTKSKLYSFIWRITIRNILSHLEINKYVYVCLYIHVLHVHETEFVCISSIDRFVHIQI